MKTKIGLIRVMTLTEDVIHAAEEKLESIYEGIEVCTISIMDQPDGVHGEESYNRAEPKVVEAAKALEGMGVKSILVNCAADPGVKKARKAVNIPVIGAGSASALVAKSTDLKVGIIGIIDECPEAIRIVLGDLIVGNLVPDNVETAVDLSNEAIIDSMKACGRELMSRGAQCILLTCTGMSPIGAATKLREYLGIPVIDPMVASMNSLYHITTGKPKLV